jgi:hypothetical protein
MKYKVGDKIKAKEDLIMITGGDQWATKEKVYKIVKAHDDIEYVIIDDMGTNHEHILTENFMDNHFEIVGVAEARESIRIRLKSLMGRCIIFNCFAYHNELKKLFNDFADRSGGLTKFEISRLNEIHKQVRRISNEER